MRNPVFDENDLTVIEELQPIIAPQFCLGENLGGGGNDFVHWDGDVGAGSVPLTL